MNTPTPRTDAAWAKTFKDDEDQCRAGNAATDMRDASATLERELAALTAERDQLRADCENETKWAAHYLAQSIADRARAERAEAAQTVALARWNGALERALKAEADLAALEQCHDDNCRAVVQLDAELAAERARLDWVFRNCKVTADDYTTGNRDVYAIHDREDLGAAMKEDAK